MVLEPRDTQTQVKHLIISDYLDTWAGIILNGVSVVAKQCAAQGRPFRTRLLYVDGFGYKGRYLGNTGDLLRHGVAATPTWGSPVLGIQALERARDFARDKHGFHVETSVVIAEDDVDDFADLVESIRLAGFSDRLILNPNSVAPSDGQIIAIRGNFLRSLNDVVTLAKDLYTHSFFLLDPYGPTGIPYQEVSRIVSLQHTDVMINYPFYDLLKKQGILNREEEKPADHALLANYDAMFGTTEWREIRTQAIAGASRDDVGRSIGEALAGYYLERLRVADSGLAVKYVELEFPDRDRTMFYLYLTTHDPTGALMLNGILHDAKLKEYQLKRHFQQSKWIHKAQEAGQLFLMSPEEDPAPEAPDVRDVDISELADVIWQTYAGQTKTWRQVYTMLANTDVFVSEIAKAMTYLKRKGLATYQDNKLDVQIRFNRKGKGK